MGAEAVVLGDLIYPVNAALTVPLSGPRSDWDAPWRINLLFRDNKRACLEGEHIATQCLLAVFRESASMSPKYF